MTIFPIFIALIVLLVVGFTWVFIYYFANPVLEHPDGIAKVVGNCGDTMELGLTFKDGVVDDTHHWTDGCSFSVNCLETVANMARAKTIEELKQINMVTIIDEVGQLPETHLHCAQLAEITLQRSVENYLERQQNLLTGNTKS